MYSYFSTEYHISGQNIIILFWKYVVDIRSEAWLNLFWEYINGKLFAVLRPFIYIFLLNRKHSLLPKNIPCLSFLAICIYDTFL